MRESELGVTRVQPLASRETERRRRFSRGCNEKRGAHGSALLWFMLHLPKLKKPVAVPDRTPTQEPCCVRRCINQADQVVLPCAIGVRRLNVCPRAPASRNAMGLPSASHSREFFCGLM